MSKYYISADLEGVHGISSWQQCYPKTDGTGYRSAVTNLAWEITTLIEHLRAQDPAAEFVVNDAHSWMTNLTLAMLPSNVTLISGKPKTCAMMAGLDASFDAAFLLGYHAKAGTTCGVLNHSYHDMVFDITLNGQSMGEGGLNALYANLVHQVPVLLAAGDAAFCEEMTQTLPQVSLIQTKTGLSTTAAVCTPREQVGMAYQHAVASLQLPVAKSKQLTAIHAPSTPFTLTITFLNTLACDVVMTAPWYTRLDGRTVRVDSPDFKVIYQALQTAYTLLAYAKALDV